MQHCLNKDEWKLARWVKAQRAVCLGVYCHAKRQKFDVQASAPLTAQGSFHLMDIQDVVV